MLSDIQNNTLPFQKGYKRADTAHAPARSADRFGGVVVPTIVGA